MSRIETLLERGQQLFEQGAYELAEQVFETVLQMERSNGHAWNGLGSVLHMTERPREAEIAFLKAVLFLPQPLQALTNLAVGAHKSGRADDVALYLAGLRQYDRTRYAVLTRSLLPQSSQAPVRVVAIGCSPSSGSTLLADLLDSCPGIACGPELYVFCYPSAYTEAFPFADHVEPILRSPGCYQMNRPFFSPRVAEVGLSSDDRKKMIESAGTLRPFVEDLSARYSSFRDKEVELFVEKTPMNVNCLPQFCSRFPEDGFFVHLVRDGRTVVSSLMRRGWTLYEAAYTWMAQVQCGARAGEYENAQELRYEDLLDRRFEMVSELATYLGHDVDAQTIQAGFENNEYRAGLARVAAWSVSDFSKEIKRTDTFRDRLSPVQIALLERLQSIPSDGAGMLAGQTDFRGLLVDYGYPPENLEVDEAELRSLFESEERAYLEREDPRLVQQKKLLSLRAR